MTDYVTEYAKKVANGEITTVGRLGILACKRHLKDLSRANDDTFDYIFDVEEANRIISFAETHTIGEGDELEQLRLYDVQKFILGSLIGWINKETGHRRFRESYVQLARQNGKTVLSAILAEYISSFCGYRNGKIILCATKMQQAKLCFDDIAKFISADKDLQELFDVKDYKNEIISNVTGTRIIAFGRDTKGIDGHRAILGICDELHQHPTNQLYKLIQGGQGKLKECLINAITTAGFDLNSFCKEHYDMCVKILEGVVDKETQFVYIAQMDKDDDIWDYKNWAKANPVSLLNRDYTYNDEAIKTMQQTSIDAKIKGGMDLVDFKTKQLNEWVDWTDKAYLNLEHFKNCESDLTLEDMRGRKCYIGLDLSSGGDLTSLGFVFKLDNEKFYIHSHSFIPSGRLAEHEKSDLAPYRQWSLDGLITATEGVEAFKTDYKYIITYLKETIDKYDLKPICIGYDNHNASSFLADLEQFNVPLVEVKQKAHDLNQATVDFKNTVDSEKVLYNKKDSLLRWSFTNAEIVPNSMGEVKINKNLQRKRIDPCDSIIDAWHVMLTEVEKVDINEHIKNNGFSF